ncbi:condensin complex subunit SMC1 [Gymnopus androsaceus JB14]|uniref:Structural maintenance of chromosomes protein n=1 Tax=Gymnopus androsaceus JB14 TaxID=1447944 RepID=A0A6A4I2G2_9AGAR|nr:condensin complex subunit SMC1 [Gymnopus androsaceus JB14]
MPLVRIEVCDFKSYRGHQTIGPFKNFTSVIGPNGAGNAQLRSSQLKDLVYRGRRLARENPDGSMAVDEEDEEEEDEGEGTAKKAWVSAVYVDVDNKEWTFQRTISTTGASEYKLNNRVVTYSAYNAALVSHNILVKAKNSLVFQGDVEAVASQSPRELSKLIEQISGSLELAAEYEKAKEEQDKATENATFNFSKRRGIAGRNQAAERFEAMEQERDALILHRILFKLFHIEESIERNAHEIRVKNKDLTRQREEQRVHDEALDAARADQAKARTGVMQMEKKIKKGEKALDAKRPDLVSVEAQMTHSTRKVNNATKTQQEVAKTQSELEDRVNNLQAELAKVKRDADKAQEAQRKMSQNNLALSEESLEEYRKPVCFPFKTSANLLAIEERQKLEKLLREEKSGGRSLNALKEKQQGLEEKRDSRSEDLTAQNAKKVELEKKLAELQTELATKKQELENQQSERTKISQLEAQANEKLQSVYQQLLQAGVDRNESERERKLKETLTSLQRIFPGVRGRVIDLCKPSQRKYETAVSVVLGRNIDAVVVDEEKTAIDCIEYMRNQRAGQATFLPLDTIQVKSVNDKFRSFAKGARLAVDVIQYEPAVERAMHHACSNALVCDTMDVAKYVCYEKGQEVKAVTLDGTIIHKSGLITGGRSTHGSEKKWDEKDVQGLQKSRDSLLTKLRDLSKQKPRGKTDENLIAEISQLESNITIVRDELNACKTRLTGLKDELKHLEREIQKNGPELKKAQKDHDKLEREIAALSDAVNSAEDGVFADFCQTIGVSNIREFEERQLKLAQEESEARLRYDNQIARLTHQSEYEGEALRNSRERLSHLEGLVETEEVTLASLRERKQTVEQELADLEEGISAHKEELGELQEVLDEKTKVVEQAKRTASKSSKGLDQALKEISTRNDEIEKLAMERSATYRKCRLEEIKLPLLEGNLRNVPMEENLRDEVAMDVDGDDEDGTQRPKAVQDYGIEVDFEDVGDDEREDGSPEALAELDAQITKLNAEIERIAPNMKAMERLDDVEQKLADTEAETEKARKDSKTAREKFQDVQKRRTQMFMNAYNHISDHIDQVYKDLTKGKSAPMGGVAYLSLDDSEEPYNGGIKYHAMPPMKRFRDMEQLSGGEKTVAALALLFAIHSYQPAPFFVLDEVDAALDNTNVAKVANYIKSQASSSFQFVVISLKGSLYERGDSLVGIYRDQEVNSSRTLTLDLTQYDDE